MSQKKGQEDHETLKARQNPPGSSAPSNPRGLPSGSSLAFLELHQTICDDLMAFEKAVRRLFKGLCKVFPRPFQGFLKTFKGLLNSF
jgi:hypothetical protein